MADMKVPMLDLKAQYQAIREPVMQAINEVCDSQWFVMGPNVTELEKRVADYSQCSFGIGVSSGTDALLVALMAIEAGPGDAVITTPYTFFATGGTIARLGARPIFCDIEPGSFNISADAVVKFAANECEQKGESLYHRSSGDRIKAILPVHLFGQTADLVQIMRVAREFNLAVIEDAAQSIGSEFADGTRAGAVGDIGCFSFFPSKNLGAFGDAGMCTTNNEDLADKMSILRLHGGKPKYYHSVIGGNFRLDAIQAAILLVKLGHLDGWTAGRQANAEYYARAFREAGLDGLLTLPRSEPGTRHIYNQYIIRGPKRDELKKFLADCGIGTEVYYPVPLHLQKCFSYLGYRSGDCPAAETAANETLAIPVYPELTDEQKSYVVSRIAEFYS